MEASETTRRRKQRVLYADRVIQQTTFANGLKNFILLEGGNHGAKGGMTYAPNFYDALDGTTETTVAEQASYIASVPGGTTVPGAPTSVVATDVGGGLVSISFIAPSTGGAPITLYTVTSIPGGITATGSGSPITVSGLSYGTAYTFTVIARNSAGNSRPSAPSNSVTLANVPDAPSSVSGVSEDSAVLVYFSVPFNGGSAILDYTVFTYNGATFVKSVVGSGSPIDVTGLTNGTAYTFTVVARNAVGNSPASDPSGPVSPATNPDPPTSLGVIPGSGQVTIYFTAGSDNGSAIYIYQYAYDTGSGFSSWSNVGSSSPVTIAGLTNGTVYTIKLRAVNGVGASGDSATVTTAPIPAFSPTSISGLNIWLDGQNVSKVVGQNPVTAWTDSSSADNNFTGVGPVSYTYSSGINNRPAMSFPSAASFSKSLNMSATNQVTIFLVARQTGQGVGNSELFYTASNYQYLDIFNRTSGIGDGALCINIGNDTQVSSGQDIITIPPVNALISFVVDTTASLYLNGTITSVSGTARGGLSLNTSLLWQIAGSAFRGDFGELITYNTPLATDNRQEIEGYLAWKWGMQGQLPVGHPYKNAPPSPPPSGNLYRAPSNINNVTDVVNSPFAGGNGSYLLPGTSANNWLNVASDDSWAFGTGDFTIEWFQYQTDTNAFPRIFFIQSSFQCSIEGGSTLYSFFTSATPTTVAPYKNAWHHFAIVRSNGVLKVYKDGVSLSSVANTTNLVNSGNPLYIGYQFGDGVPPRTAFGGYLTNFRIVKGLAVYTGDFTVPTSTLTTTAAANPYGGTNTAAIPNGFTKLLLTPALLNVLILGDSQASLVSAGLSSAKLDLGLAGSMNITIKDIAGADNTYTGADLSSYNVVILYTNGSPYTYTTLGSNLNSWLAGGGNLVMGVFAWGNVTQFPIDYTSYSAFVYMGTQASETSAITNVGTHPITTGIDSSIFITGSATTPISLTSGASTIAQYSDTTPFIATKSSGSSRFVGINTYFAKSYASSSDKNNYYYLCNSLFWAVGAK